MTPACCQAAIDFAEEQKLSRLRKLWESLQVEILSVIEATNELRESAEHELKTLVAQKPQLLDDVIQKQVTQLEAEIAQMKEEEAKLESEIGELAGN